MRETQSERAIETAKTLNTILCAGVGMLAGVALLRLLGAAEFEWVGIKIALKYSWIVTLAFTVAHAWVAVDLVSQVYELWKTGSVDENNALFGKITSAAGVFLRGMHPRVRNSDGSRFYRMSARDPTAWLSLAGALTLLLALLPTFSGDFEGIIDRTVLALALLWVNWILGTGWSMAISLLTIKYGTTSYGVDTADVFLYQAFLSGESLPSSILLKTFALAFCFVFLLIGTAAADLLKERGLPTAVATVVVVLSRVFLAYQVSRLVWGYAFGFLEDHRRPVRVGVLAMLGILLVFASLRWVVGPGLVTFFRV